MLPINCFIGRLRPTIEMDFPLTLMGKSIPEFFSIGSLNAAGRPAIALNMDVSRWEASKIRSDQPTSAKFLHGALAKLTRNPAVGGIVSRIGLILADRYAHNHGLLGLMFDQGFNPAGMEPVGPVFTSVPREGCAIFLNTIRDIRPIISDFQKEIVFTAIHELGHVFNLWHLHSPVTFMSTSDVNGPFGSSAFRFHPDHRRFLVRAETDVHVIPGGSNFNVRGPFGASANDPLRTNVGNSDLQLQISVSRREFWFFEPIELDVELFSNTGAYVIKNEVDPGYERFVMHIKRPDGTIFRYRSPRLYCQNVSMLKVDPEKRFLRDVSIFGQSGGYTFQSPGEYQVQCFLDTGLGFTIQSNVLSVFVRAPHPNKINYSKKEQVLTKQGPALLLYHRSGNFSPKTVNLLMEIAKKDKKSSLAISIFYALSRFKTQTKKKIEKREMNTISRLTNTALDSGKLGRAMRKNLVLLKDEFGII